MNEQTAEHSVKPVLVMSGVGKSIGKTDLVQPFDLTVRSGETIALCGGNGAGKSTILRMIAGISRPSSGTIRINGLEWENNRIAYAEQIGYMPDDFDFGLALTAYETLRFYGELKGLTPANIDEALTTVGLQHVRNKRVAAFSKGMRQRLLFAQALLASPPLLVLDEPTNGLDPYWLEAFVMLMRQVKAAGQTVIFSTHHLQSAEAAADRVVFLNAGRIYSTGTVQHYKDIYGEAGLNAAFGEMLSQAMENPIRST